MANYVIVGAGRDASHPIQVNVRCDDSTTICWIGKYCKTVCDVEMCTEDQYCETVSTTSEGPHQTTWTDPDGISHTVYYTVKRDCPSIEPPSCEYTCSDLTAYAVPSSVAESYTGNIDIHYEYYLTCVRGDYIGDRVRKSGVKTVPFSSFSDYSYNLSVDGCSTTVKVGKKEDDDCTEGCVADISITFSQDIVPASGKTIQVIVSFKKTVTDENCKKKVTTGSFSYPWEVKCTSTGETDKHCCMDHYVEGSISKERVQELAKLNNCELRYDGEQTELDFYYKVLQRGKTTEECEGYCEEKTTYCADQSTVKVCYEKRYLSNEWVCEGDPSTDCDCTALSIEGVNGAYAVPFTGGRIKVTWQYSAHTTTETCNEYDTLGRTWEEIITIGGCDERPIDCKPEYNTVVVDEEGHTAVYDDTTYKDCEICDSECCYNYDGKGRCKCVILFKEQPPSGCTTCDSCTVWDDEEKRNITYNKIRYEFVQDCTTICNYDKSTQFEQKEINVDKCFTGETAATVPFTSTTEYYGAGCPAPEVIIDSVEAKANIPTVNNSNKPKVAYEDDMIKVIQAAGPCEVPTYCDCDALTLEGGGGDCPEGEATYVYGTVNIECRKYASETVQVPYSKYCNGTLISKGTSAKTISVDCNQGAPRDITVSGIKVHQAGGCTDAQCGEGPTPPVSDCDGFTEDATLNAYISNITKGRINTVLTDIISADGTKCTYKYLKTGYDFVKNKPQATISWFLANMMAELTPYVISTPKDMYLTLQNPLAGDTATNYFVNASHKYGGLKLNYFTSEQTYNERIDGGIQYALFKYSDYDGTNAMAEYARTELRAINTDLEAQAKLRHDSDQDPSHSNPYFTRDDAVHMLPIVPNDFPTNNPCETGCDWGYTQSIINQYPDAQSLSGVHDFQALRDKDTSNEYFASILGLSGNKWLTYLYNTQDIGDAGGNQMKGKFRRPRPGTQNNLNSSTGGTTFSFPAGHPNAVVYMCDCSIEYGSSTTGGSNCDYCIRDIDNFTNTGRTDDNPYKSYSSGHSARAMINLLTTLEVAGDSMSVAGYTSRTQRIMDYCHNRVVVRAHWKSDTIAGKLASAAQIGYLNGYIEFHEDVDKLKNS